MNDKTRMETLRTVNAAGESGFENRDLSRPGRYFFPRQRMATLLKDGLIAEFRSTPNSIARYVLTDSGRTALATSSPAPAVAAGKTPS